jgi:exopolysaccharide biosynthesis polyprenyl glycosylphosphotransferase
MDVSGGRKSGRWILGYQWKCNGGNMLKYPEAGEVSTKRRILRFQGAAAKEAAAVDQPSDPQVIDLRDGRETAPTALAAASVSILPLQQRRAVGRTLVLLGHLFDFLALLLPLTLGYIFLNDQISMKVVVLFAAVGTALLWPTARRGRHAVAPSEGLASVVARLGLAPVVTLIIVSIVNLGRFGMPSESIDVFVIAQIVLATVPLVLLGRLVSFRLVAAARSKGYDLEDALIIGIGPIGLDLAQALLDTPSFGLVPCGFVDRFQEELPLPILGRPENLPEILEQTGIRHVVLAFGSAGEEELVSIIRRCQDRMVQFYAVPRLFELGLSAGDVGYEVSGLPLVPVRRPGMSCNMWPAKRAFDLVAASALFLLTLPLLVGCALAVKLTSRGPVFFRQVRIGVGGRPFEILKFRSMKVNDESSTQWSVEEDDRVTKVGRFLRPSHLDELPQLINVLRGEMSLVGPRPERPHFVEQFSSEIDSYQYRHRVPVGITGWAQVNGYWGDTSIETRVRLDNRYIENWSLWRDLVIGLRTIPTLLGKRR